MTTNAPQYTEEKDEITGQGQDDKVKPTGSSAFCKLVCKVSLNNDDKNNSNLHIS